MTLEKLITKYYLKIIKGVPLERAKDRLLF